MATPLGQQSQNQPYSSRAFPTNMARPGGQYHNDYAVNTAYRQPEQHQRQQASNSGYAGATSGQQGRGGFMASQQQQAEQATVDQGALESLSEEQREEVNEAFALFDLDKDNHIDYHETKVAFKALGFEIPKAELLTLLQNQGISAAIVHNTGPSKVPSANQQPSFMGPSRLLLPQAAFVAEAAKKIADRDPEEEIMRAFELFDREGKGMIDINDLRRVAKELGEGLSDEEMRAMIEEFDVRGQGGIDRGEFIGICMG